jgi:hypothetical protein
MFPFFAFAFAFFAFAFAFAFFITLRKTNKNGIILRKSRLIPDQWGVFATKDFQVGDIVEICPTVPVRDKKMGRLDDYVFRDNHQDYVVFGYGSIYNHLDRPNLKWKLQKKHQVMVYKAVLPIQSGEELFVSYGSSYWKDRSGKKSLPTTKN